MFGFVMADSKELSKEQKKRYGAVYCGICRSIRSSASNAARVGLSYDMAFLALLLQSLYEPEETLGDRACLLHPVSKRGWVDSKFVRYAADMNVLLAYYNCRDDYEDEGKPSAKLMAGVFGKTLPELEEKYLRQCQAVKSCLQQLQTLEAENCPNPDEPANCFGQLMGELLVYEEDLWAATLRKMGMALGRYIYLADAAIDYRRDLRKKQYNPYIAAETGENWALWEQYLVLDMGKCTDYYERLPLVQDKALLDNILYSGIWITYRRKQPGGKK